VKSDTYKPNFEFLKPFMQIERLYLGIYVSRMDAKSFFQICNSDWDFSVQFDQNISGKVICRHKPL